MILWKLTMYERVVWLISSGALLLGCAVEMDNILRDPRSISLFYPWVADAFVVGLFLAGVTASTIAVDCLDKIHLALSVRRSP